MSNYSSSPLYKQQEPPKSESSSSQGKFIKFFSLCCTSENDDANRNMKKPRSQTMRNVEDEMPKQQPQIRKYSETEQMVQSLPVEGKYELRWYQNSPIPIYITKKENKRLSTIQLSAIDNICNSIYSIPTVRQSETICLFTQKPSSYIIEKFKEKQLVLIVDKNKKSKVYSKLEQEFITMSSHRKMSNSSNGSLQPIIGSTEVVIGARQLKSYVQFDSIIILPRFIKQQSNDHKFNSVIQYIEEISTHINIADVWSKVFIILPTQFDQLDEVLNIIWKQAIHQTDKKEIINKQKQKTTSLSLDFDNKLNKLVAYIKIEVISHNDSNQYIIINFQKEGNNLNQELDSIIDLLTDQMFFCSEISQITHQQKEELRELAKQCSLLSTFNSIKEIKECKLTFNSLNQIATQSRYFEILHKLKIDLNVVHKIFTSHGAKIQDYQNYHNQFDQVQQQVHRQPSKSIDLDENDNSLLPNSFGHQMDQTNRYTFPIEEYVFEY